MVKYVKYIVQIQCILLIALTVLGGFCVRTHDSYHASDRSAENAFMALGHFDSVLFEDGLVVALLVVAATSHMIFRANPAQIRKTRIASLGAVSVILLIQFFAEITILGTEDQRLLGSAGNIARVLEVLLSGGSALWSGTISGVLFSIDSENNTNKMLTSNR